MVWYDPVARQQLATSHGGAPNMLKRNVDFHSDTSDDRVVKHSSRSKAPGKRASTDDIIPRQRAVSTEESTRRDGGSGLPQGTQQSLLPGLDDDHGTEPMSMA